MQIARENPNHNIYRKEERSRIKKQKYTRQELQYAIQRRITELKQHQQRSKITERKNEN